MWNLAIRLGIGILLVVRGFAHFYVTSGWKADRPARSWLLGDPGAGQGLATALWVASLVAFITAGVATMAFPAWWRPLSIAAAAISLLTLALFWQPGVVVGALVDVAILVALLWARWLAPASLGA